MNHEGEKKESKRGGWSHSVLRASPIFHGEGTVHLDITQLRVSPAAVCAPFRIALGSVALGSPQLLV